MPRGVQKLESSKRIIKLNIGCGEKQLDGYIGIDIKPIKGVKHVVDLDYGGRIPYPNKSVDEIYTTQFLEHLVDVETLTLEMIRVLKPGGKLYIKVPFYGSVIAHEPSHKSFFSPYSFNFYTKGRSVYKFSPMYLEEVYVPRMTFEYFFDWKDKLLLPILWFANKFRKPYLFCLSFVLPASYLEFSYTRVIDESHISKECRDWFEKELWRKK